VPDFARIGHKAIATAERSELVDLYRHIEGMGREWIKRQIIERNRIDILATYVLGYSVEPFHLRMLQYQFQHPDNLILVFRGAGKSTICTITKTIHLLLKNPNLRVLIASKVVTQSQTFLKEIKGHFESNKRLEELFGPYFDPRKVSKWDENEIEVLPRTVVSKEGSVTCVGVDGAVVGRHYDVIISDDLVDENNTRTQHQRDKTKTWYYQTLDPTLEPPSPDVPHRGEHHRLGTRYHHADMYGHLQNNEMKDSTLIIRALDEHGRSPWPSKYPPKWFHEKRRKSGIIIFNAQYQCDTEAMKGEIFQYDDCQRVEDSEIPTELRVFMGIDLAISEKETADKFAIVVIGMDADRRIYVLDFYEDQLRFGEQTKKIKAMYRKWKPVRALIETNAYQAAQYQTLKDSDPDIRLKPVTQDKDKITRAWKLSPVFEDKRVFFKKNQHALIEHMVLFPNHRYKDLFDAFDLAVRASKLRTRKGKRRPEPGLI
jgi:predicted phage terminase large subunit-like protein